MRRSKLEKYLDILEVLARQGPSELKHILREVNANFSVLKQYLDFLIQQNLVKEQTSSKDQVFYVITERGLKVLNIAVPIIEEARKIQTMLH